MVPEEHPFASETRTPSPTNHIEKPLPFASWPLGRNHCLWRSLDVLFWWRGSQTQSLMRSNALLGLWVLLPPPSPAPQVILDRGKGEVVWTAFRTEVDIGSALAEDCQIAILIAILIFSWIRGLLLYGVSQLPWYFCFIIFSLYFIAFCNLFKLLELLEFFLYLL